MFDRKKNNKSRLVADKFLVQKHFDGYLQYAHSAKNVELNPEIKLYGINNTFDNFYDVCTGILQSINLRLANLTATLYTPGFILVSGDISGTGTNLTVSKLRGTTLSVPSIISNRVLRWNGSVWNLSVNTPAGSAAGDLNGTYPNPSVKSLSISGNKGDILIFDGTKWTGLPAGNSGYVLESFGSGNSLQWSPRVTTPGGTAGGNLSGTYPNPGISSVSLSSFNTFDTNTIISNVTNSTAPASYISLDHGLKFNSSSFTNKISINNYNNMNIEEHFVRSTLYYFKSLDVQNGATVTLTSDGYALGIARLAFSGTDDGRVTIGTPATCYLIGNERFIVRFSLSTDLATGNEWRGYFGFFDSLNTTSVVNGVFFRIIRGSTGAETATLTIVKEGLIISTALSTSFTLGKYYTALLRVSSSKCSCVIFDENGTTLETITYTYGVFGGPTSFPVVNMYAGAAIRKLSTFSAKNIINIDYISVGLN